MNISKKADAASLKQRDLPRSHTAAVAKALARVTRAPPRSVLTCRVGDQLRFSTGRSSTLRTPNWDSLPGGSFGRVVPVCCTVVVTATQAGRT